MFSWVSLKKFFERAWRIGYSAILGFWYDDCYTKASTLTFYTLQSIVPFLAAALAVAKGFGFDEYLEKVITTTFVEQKEVLDYAIQIALSMLSFISSGEIVGIGVILLLWTNINLVGYIELALNDIWKVKVSRSMFQKVKDFSFAVVVFPLIFVASSSATLYVKAQIHHFYYFATINEMLIHDFRFLLPWLLSCFLFGALFFLIPNAKVRVVPRLLASLIAGTLFQLWQVVFINLQVYIFSYNIVYGAFALLPLFLIWLQFSWMIALAGAEISAHIENYRLYTEDLPSVEYVRISRRELAFLILYECLTTFYGGKSPLSASKLSERLKVSPREVEDVLAALERHEVLVPFKNKGYEICYHPLYDPSRLKLLTICDIIDQENELGIAVESSEVLRHIQDTLQAIHHQSEESPVNIPLCDFFRLNKT